MLALKSNEIVGNWAALLLPIERDDSINFSKLSDEIDVLLSMKVNGIYSNGTSGEFYNQTEDEFDKVNMLLAEKCEKAAMPYQVGCSHMSPRISLHRVRRAVSLKPGAIQLIIPDWFPPTIQEIVSFLQVMAEAADGIGLVLYNPPHAKKKLHPDDFDKIKVAGIPLTGCKVGGGDANWYAEMRKSYPGLSLFVPGSRLATGITLGAHGAYSNVACLHPRVAQRWYNTMLADMKSALEMENRIQLFLQNYILPFITVEKYSDPAIDKLLASITGWSGVSTRLRWPYRWISEDEVVSIRSACRKILPEFFY